MSSETNADHEPRMPIRWAGLNDVGKVRSANEDAFVADPHVGLFIVSDGLGGHQAGGLASKTVVNVLPQIIKARLTKLSKWRMPRSRAIRYWLRQDICRLSTHLHDESGRQMGLLGMGATLVMVLVRNGIAHIASMGDSRAYLLRRQQLTQLTDDHSIIGLLLRCGEIRHEDVQAHPARCQLSRYVGIEGDVYPDVRSIALENSDRLLLCSDGLTGAVADERIARLLLANQDPATACRTLIGAANAAGGLDNITAVIIDWQASRD